MSSLPIAAGIAKQRVEEQFDAPRRRAPRAASSGAGPRAPAADSRRWKALALLLGAGLAGSTAALLTARAVQGVAAAIMTPTALSIVMTTFPEGAERNKATVAIAIAALGVVAASLLLGRSRTPVAETHPVIA